MVHLVSQEEETNSNTSAEDDQMSDLWNCVMWKNTFITKLIANVTICIIRSQLHMDINELLQKITVPDLEFMWRLEDDGLIMFFMLEAERLLFRC